MESETMKEVQVNTTTDALDATPTTEPSNPETIPQKHRHPTASTASFDYLREQFHSEEMSYPAKRILKRVLDDCGFNTDELYQPPQKNQLRTRIRPLPLPLQHDTKNKNKIKTFIPDKMTELETLELAQSGQLSFLGSILQVVASAKGEVPAKQIVKSTGLCLFPPLVPTQLEAKDMVLAALFFLSNGHTTIAQRENTTTSLIYDHFSLPLLHVSTKSTTDPDKMAYIKAHPWSMEELTSVTVTDTDTQPLLLQLERIFFSNVSNYTWVPRGKLCPRSHDEPNSTLLTRGLLPMALRGRKSGLSPYVSYYDVQHQQQHQQAQPTKKSNQTPTKGTSNESNTTGHEASAAVVKSE